MGTYTLPQVRVFQEFAETPNDVTQNLNPFLIGPNYQLMRYAEEDERDDCATAEYVGVEKLIAWSSGYSGSTVDTTYYGVTLENAYCKFGEKNARCLNSNGTNGTKFEFTLTDGKSLTGETSSQLEFGTPIKAGDMISYKNGDETVYTKIVDITSGTIEEGKISYSLKNKSTGSDVSSDDVLVVLTDYVGEKPVTVNITATATNKISWTSSIAGISGTDKTITVDGLDLGKGLKIKLASTGKSLGVGTYTLKVTIEEGYAYDTVTVADFIPATVGATKALTILRVLDAAELDSEYLSVGTTGVTVLANAKVVVGSDYRDVVKATAYLTQRNFVKSYADGVYSVSSDTDITNKLGAITPDNPLAYGAHVMLLNCATATIKIIAVESDDLEGFTMALDRASVTTDVYAFCPLSEDRTIIDAVVAHCKNLSTAEEKSWRISFFSMPTAESVDVTPNSGGLNEQCTVDGTTLTCRPRGGATTQTSTIANFTGTVQEDDIVEVTTSAGTKFSATVVAVTSNYTLTLDKSLTETSKLRPFTITHPRGVPEYVDAIAATSSSFRNRRAYNVFPNKLRNSDGTYVSGMYGAAAVCALACSVAPQQPITNVEINGFTDLPDVYSKCNRDQLNTIAAGGTLILMQDKIGGTVYVRHQISTAYPDGNLNTTELSLTKNLDSISYYFANRFAPYIGRYNITDDLLTELKGVLKDGLAHLETSTETNKLVGPQVLVEGTEVTSVYVDSEEQDKVYANVSLSLPKPFNNFDLRLQVI